MSTQRGYRKLVFAFILCAAVIVPAGSALAVATPAKPSITGFSPLSIKPLSSLTITGKNFTGVKTVTVGGKRATFRVVSATSVTVTVPNTAISGKVVVVTATGSATSSRTLTVLAASSTTTLVGNPVAGKALFIADCSECHTLTAARAHGNLGPNLNDVSLTEPVLINAIIHGGSTVMSASAAADYSTTMTAFGPPVLTTIQVDDIAAFVYASTH